MADEVRSAFQSAWSAGPSSNPDQPNKSDIWNAGGVIDSLLAQVVVLIGTSIKWKDPVRAASAINVSLVGLTAGSSAGGVTLVAGNRIGLTAQTNALENGIWVIQASGGPVRSTDADTSSEILAAAFFVTEGTNVGKSYLCTTVGTIVLNTTPLTFVLISDIAALNATIAALSAKVDTNIAAITTASRIGPVTPVGGALTAGDRTYLRAEPIEQDGYISRIKVNLALAGEFRLKFFRWNGTQFVQRGSDVVYSLSSGYSDLAVSVQVYKADYVGFYSQQLTFRSGTDPDGGFILGPATGNVSSFSNTVSTETAILDFAVETRAAGGDVADHLEDRLVRADITVSGTALGSTNILWQRNGKTRQYSEASRPLTATTAGTIRYDLLYFDMNALVLQLRPGTERQYDPTFFIPAAAGPGELPVAYIRVAGAAVQVMPLDGIYDGDMIELITWLEARRRKTRRAIPKFRAKHANGQSLRILGMGDSIFALESDVPSTSLVNGPYRDRAKDVYLLGTSGNGYGSDVRATIPTYTAAQIGRGSDATAAAAGTVFTKIGIAWELIAALEAEGRVLGTDLFYDNFAKGGTQTSDYVSGSTPTAFLTAIAAQSADLVLIHLGQNELGNTGTEARAVVIANTLKATGKEVIFVGCGRNTKVGLDVPIESCELTNSALAHAADYTGCGFIPVHHLYDYRYIKALGVFSQDTNESNHDNHPGLREMQLRGRQVAKGILG